MNYLNAKNQKNLKSIFSEIKSIIEEDENRKRSVAQYLQHLGRHGDTILAHINPEEARILKAMGGRGTINPRTGLREYLRECPHGFDLDEEECKQCAEDYVNEHHQRSHPSLTKSEHNNLYNENPNANSIVGFDNVDDYNNAARGYDALMKQGELSIEMAMQQHLLEERKKKKRMEKLKKGGCKDRLVYGLKKCYDAIKK